MSAGRFPPVEALRAIGQVCADKDDFTPAMRLAIVRVILYAANDTGFAWASYRAITRETGLSSATIRAALKAAEGRYLTRAGVFALSDFGATGYIASVQCAPADSPPNDPFRARHRA